LAISVSQRSILLQVMATQSKSPKPLGTLKADIGKYGAYAEDVAVRYIASLSPSSRMKSVVCSPGRPDDSFRMSRSQRGFHTNPPTMSCAISIDGKEIEYTSGDFYNGDDWDTVKGLAEGRAAADAAAFTAFQAKARDQLQIPLQGVTQHWREVASRLV
jgi:hypothetical protein